MGGTGYYEPKNGGFSLGVSVFLHVAVFLFLFLSAYMKFLFEPPKAEPIDMVFEMISDAQIQPSPLRVPAPNPSPSQLKVDNMKDLRPLDLPPPPPPLPDPVPPPPVPSPTPKPAPTTTKPVPKMTYEEYVKQHGAPRDTSNRPRNTSPAKPVEISEVRIGNKSFEPTAISSDNSASYTGNVTQNEMQSYVSYVYSLAKQNWVAPSELMGINLNAKVRLSIASNGRVSSVKILKSSGETAFDSSIERLFKTLSFIAPPRGEALSVDFTFSAKD